MSKSLTNLPINFSKQIDDFRSVTPQITQIFQQYIILSQTVQRVGRVTRELSPKGLHTPTMPEQSGLKANFVPFSDQQEIKYYIQNE